MPSKEAVDWFGVLLKRAHHEAMEAVREHYPDADENTDPGGAVGFAWINIRPGTSSFARWLVKQGHARKGSASRGGVNIWVSHFGQSDALKHLYATAYARHLRASDFDATPMSRLD